ncbi:hypothetical protein TWF718_002388 [Orbilia javanica]|uniref:Uncharacterized protein n=1 Tax=Orbilia javanica TaxID=47235 RepID=A0AAN8RJQ0_9PEZI
MLIPAECQCIRVLRAKDEPEAANRDPFSAINAVPEEPPKAQSPVESSDTDSILDLTLDEDLLDEFFNFESIEAQKMRAALPYTVGRGYTHPAKRRKILVPGTKEPYYLEGPDEYPARKHRLSLYDIIGGVSRLGSSHGFKAKRSSNPDGSLYISPTLSPTTNPEALESSSYNIDSAAKTNTNSDTKLGARDIVDSKGPNGHDSSSEDNPDLSPL